MLTTIVNVQSDLVERHRNALVAVFVISTSMLASQALATPVEETELFVSNGTQAAECAFPSVVLLRNCTGTLVHPRVVVYAAHCGRNQTVRLTHASGKGQSLEVEKCNVNPRYKGASQEHLDWAYCTLKAPAVDWPITPVAAGCELDLLAKSGATVVQAGFGQSNDGGPSFGRKRYASSKISTISEKEINVGDDGGVVACPGDSGGPLLARLEDGSWRTIGITSTYNGRCGKGGMNTYANIVSAISWIEKDSGIDITPCFDENQEWQPGADCGGFFAAEASDASGAWSDKCQGTKVSGASSTCGTPAKDEEDPTAKLVLEHDETLVEPARIAIEVEAEDNVAVTSVELFVDGKSKGAVKTSPYKWELEDLKAGSYVLEAVASDAEDNSGSSEKVTVEVAPPEKSGGSKTGEESQEKPKSSKSDKKESGSGAESKKSSGGESDQGEDGEGEEGNSKDNKDDDGENSSKGGGCSTRVDDPSPLILALALFGLVAMRQRSNVAA